MIITKESSRSQDWDIWKYINLLNFVLFDSKQIGRIQSSSERDIKKGIYSTKCSILWSLSAICEQEKWIYDIMHRLLWIESSNCEKKISITLYEWFDWFTKLNLKKCFNQIWIANENIHKITFCTRVWSFWESSDNFWSHWSTS